MQLYDYMGSKFNKIFGLLLLNIVLPLILKKKLTKLRKWLTVLTSNDKIYRLPVIVSGYSDIKSLDVPKIPNGTGEAQSTAIYDSLK